MKPYKDHRDLFAQFRNMEKKPYSLSCTLPAVHDLPALSPE